MLSVFEVVLLLAVSILWGCTNPLLRKGYSESSRDESLIPSSSEPSSAVASLTKFRNFHVWIPYVLNQAGSLLYYFTLANSDISLAVPICNALALVFSIVTSYSIGEQIHKPFQTIVGAAFVVIGVTLCVVTREGPESSRHPVSDLLNIRSEL
jgi:drug/metabolite transporter (DMT)-like permease